MHNIATYSEIAETSNCQNLLFNSNKLSEMCELENFSFFPAEQTFVIIMTPLFLCQIVKLPYAHLRKCIKHAEYN